MDDPDEETKQDSSASSMKGVKTGKDVWIDSDEDEEEERRIVRAAKELNR